MSGTEVAKTYCGNCFCHLSIGDSDCNSYDSAKSQGND